MIYRCHTCQREESRGWLPSASCGPYAMFLLALSTGALAAAAQGLRMLVADQRLSGESISIPWWMGVVAVIVGLVLVVVGVVVIKWILELMERLAFARRRCPTCGSRRWSWGFTRGFGL